MERVKAALGHRWIKRTLLMIIIAALCCAPAFADNPVTGTCGDNATWSLDLTTGTLTISGQGSISSAPWYDDGYSSQITAVIINEGVTEIGWEVFFGCESLTSVSLPASLTSIDGWAFGECSSLSTVLYGGTVAQANAIGIDLDQNNALLSVSWTCTDGTFEKRITSSCGDSAAYSFSFPTHILTITGNGPISDYEEFESPWTFFRDQINSAVISQNITRIGEYAFFDCRNLSSVTIPDSVTSIGDMAFGNCTGLVNVTYSGTIQQAQAIVIGGGNNCLQMPVWTCSDGTYERPVSGSCGDGTTFLYQNHTLTISGQGSISSAPWYDDGYSGQITAVIINEGVTEIGEWTFDECENLTSVSLPASLTSICGCAFRECTSLSTVLYSGTVAQANAIGIDVDQNNALVCTSWTCTDGTFEKQMTGSCGGSAAYSFNFHTHVLTITGDGPISDYGKYEAPWTLYRDQLNSAVVSQGITRIGENVFYDCSNLSSVTIPDSVTSIGNEAFERCRSLANVTYSGTIQQAQAIVIGEGNACLQITVWACSDGAYERSISGSCGDGTTFLYQDHTLTISGEGNITSKPWESFCLQITAVIINEGVTEIGWDTFYGCENLASVTIKNAAAVIDEYAFDSCPAGTVIHGWDPSTAKTYAENAGFTFEPIITEISGSCGDNATWSLDLTTGTLTISGSGEVSYETPWYDYRNQINTLVINEGVTALYAQFRFYDSLTSVVIPDSLVDMGSDLFKSCTGLANQDGFVIVNHILYDYIGTAANITVPAGVTRIGMGAFTDCTSLTSVVIPSSVTTIHESAFYGCSALNSVSLSEGLITIDSRAFSDCTNLTEITIPNTVTSIGQCAFIGTGLTTVTLTGGISTIGGDVFEQCYHLTTIYIPVSVTTINGYAFYDCENLSAVHYAGTVAQAKAISIDFNGNGSLRSAIWTCSDGTVDEWPQNGSCGDEVTYEYQNHTLTISGQGSISSAPWYDDGYSSQITAVIINEGVTEIGWEVFFGCESLTSVSLPASLTSICGCAFRECTSLSTVLYGGTVAQANAIGIDVDQNNALVCTGWTCTDGIFEKQITSSCGGSAAYSFNFHTHVLTITGDGPISDYGEFEAPWSLYRDQLNSVVVSQGITRIGENVFYDCSNLSSVTIPDSVTSIGAHACNECPDLASVTIMNAATVIENYAFNGCPIGLVIHGWDPSTAKTYAENAGFTFDPITEFSGSCGDNTNWSLDTITHTLTISGSGEANDIPNFPIRITTLVINEGVTALYTHFNDNDTLTSVTIPDSLVDMGDEIFKGCTGLADPDGFVIVNHVLYDYVGTAASITVPAGVTKIGGHAFNGCGNLNSIIIPSSVTKISNMAFLDCASLTNVTLSEGLVSIESYAFNGCYNLTGITIPTTVTRIGGMAFSNTGLTAVTIPGNASSFGWSVFSDCENLTEVSIANGVSTIPMFAFESCRSLSSVTIPVSVVTIDDGAFDSCESLTAIYYAGTVAQAQAICIEGGNEPLRSATWTCSDGTVDEWPQNGSCGDEVTYEYQNHTLTISGEGMISDNPWSSYSKAITAVVIHEGVTGFNEELFDECENLRHITLPVSLTHIPKWAFYDCYSLSTVTYGGTVAQAEALMTDSGNEEVQKADWICSDGNVEIGPLSGVCGDGVTYVYQNHTLTISGSGTIDSTPGRITTVVTSVIINQGVTGIGSGVFYGYANLTSVTIPDSVTNIDDHAFYRCSSLANVTLPNSITYIGESAFGSCTGLTGIVIPGSVTHIDRYAFDGCTHLTSVTIPDSITYIDDGTFRRCSGLASITIPNSITRIGCEAFGDCSGLTSIVIPNSVTYIDNHAFDGCTRITSITIPDSVTRIGEWAFSGCSGLTSITISNPVAVIDDYVFEGCPAGMVIHGWDPSTTKTYANAKGLAFAAITAVMDTPDFTLPAQLTTIEAEAFSGIRASVVYIPDTVTSLGSKAFADCTYLTQIRIPDSITTIPSDVFDRIDLSKIIIFGTPGSAAQTFAGDKGVRFSAE